MIATFSVSIADAVESTPLTQGRDVITTPGIGRVIFVFILTAGLAVAIAMLLRRVLPKLGGPLLSSGNLRVVDRASLGAGLRVHVVLVDGEKVVVADSRNGVALTVLNKSRKQA